MIKQVATPADADADADADKAIFERVANAKGVTLSTGKPVKAEGAKTTKGVKADVPETDPVVKPLNKKQQKAARREEARKAAEAKLAAPALAKSTPTTPAPALEVVDGEAKPVEKVSRSIVPMKFKARYAKNAGTCGDDMALELKAATTTLNADKRETLDIDALWAIAKANEIDVTKYLTLNNGQKRMNVGNKLRGKLAAGADVVVGTRTFKAEDFVPKS